MRIGLIVVLLVFGIVDITHATDKRIAITIDDAPMGSSHLFTGAERTKKIIQHLDGYRAGIFVIGENLSTKDGRNRLKLYDEAGHMIGNHTYSHYMCRKVSAEKFIKDIDKAHQLIRDYSNFKHIFRYPYLDECKTQDKKEKVSSYLKEKCYINGYVTIVTLDWHMNNLLQKGVRNGKKVDYSKLKKFYLDTMIEYVNVYYNVYFDKLGYSPPHSLLLHENDLNALYLGDLIDLLKNNGWKIIPPEDVYFDQSIDDRINHARKNLPNIDSLKPNYIDRLFKDVIIRPINSN